MMCGGERVDELVVVVVGLEAILVIRVTVGGQGNQVGGQDSEVTGVAQGNGRLSRGGILKSTHEVEKPLAGHATYTNRFHELARGMVAATEPKTIQKAVQITGTLTDEALRNGSIKKNPEKRGNKEEPRKDRNVRDDNKRNRTGNAFATTTNPVEGGYTSTTPKCTTCSYHHTPETPYCTCFNCNRLGHFTKDCRVAPRNVNPINARNPVARTCYECGSTDHIKSACPRLNQA
nr:hypothetical protein [Tanacetum cinerariifolium]GEZ74668.1 hypothetical protein [Tanacetum cinerariifolium]